LLVEALDHANDAEAARLVCEQFIAENENSTKPAILDAIEFILPKLIRLNEWRKVVSPRQFIDTISPLYDKLVLILFRRGRHEDAVREWAKKARALAEFDTDEALAVFDSIIRELPGIKVSMRFCALNIYFERFWNTPLQDSNLIRNATEYGYAINASISEMYKEHEFEVDPTTDSDMWLFAQILEVRDRLLTVGGSREALGVLKSTLEHLDRNHDPSFYRVLEKAIAKIHIHENNLSAAIAALEPIYFTQAAGRFKELDDYEDFFDTAELIGSCYSKLQKPRKALIFLRDAISLAIERLDALERISPLVSRLIFTCHELAAQLGYVSTSVSYLTNLVRHYKDSEDDYVLALVEYANQELADYK
jgi:tetratricopeptide (TPR) repeat protein